MSVRLHEGTIRLEGNCPVEDSEPLLQLLLENSPCPVDLGGCGRLHMAVVQVLLAARRSIVGVPGNAFAAEWLLPQLLSADERT
jgi:hypothetical protein